MKECEFCSIHSDDLINLSSFPPFTRDRYVKSLYQLLELSSSCSYSSKISESLLCQQCFETLEEVCATMKKLEGIQLKITDLREKIESIFLQGQKREEDRNQDKGDVKKRLISTRDLILNDISRKNTTEDNILYPDITIKEEPMDNDEDSIRITKEISLHERFTNHLQNNENIFNNDVKSYSNGSAFLNKISNSSQNLNIPKSSKPKMSKTSNTSPKPNIPQRIPPRGPKVLSQEEVIFLKRQALTNFPHLSLIKVEQMTPEEIEKTKSAKPKAKAKRPRGRPLNSSKSEFPKSSNGPLWSERHGGPVDCKKCGKTMAHRYSLSRHIYVVHTLNSKPFSCSQCDKKFKLLSDLKEHALVHSGVCLYICEKCGKKMSSKVTLEKHVLSFHVNKEKIICPICSRNFKLLSHLKRHSEIHTRVNPENKCNICERKLSSKYTLQKHMVKKHNQPNDANRTEIIIP